MPRRHASPTNNLTDHFINGKDLHPYLKRDFWLNPSNHFWETPFHTPQAKAYHRDQVQVIYNYVL